MRTFILLSIFFLVATTACRKENEIEQITSNVVTPVIKKSPVANAGPDHRSNLPFLLDGSASTDPDGTITGWRWRKIYGPGNVAFSASHEKQCNVTVDYMGIFRFELQVTDNDGLTALDTVTIFFLLPGTTCDSTLRPVIQSSLQYFSRFPFDRFGVGVATLGTKVYFAGGRLGSSGNPTAHVAILDMETKQESSANLSIPRAFIGCVSAGTKIFFAGGWTWTSAISRVEIVDVSSGASSTAELSEARWGVATAVIGNKVFFAGGFYWIGGQQHVSSRVDIYNLDTEQWHVANLSEARGDITVTVMNGKIYFAGGTRVNSVTATIDVYDDQTGSWSILNLGAPVANAASVIADGKIYFAGGYDIIFGSGGAPLSNGKCDVQTTTGFDPSYSFTNLFSKASSLIAYRKGNNLIFFPSGSYGSYYYNIYDVITGEWFVGLADNYFRESASFIYKNDLYIAGGLIGSPDSFVFNDKILKLVF